MTLRKFPQTFFSLAAALALAASIFILMSSSEMREYVIGAEGGYEIVRQISWYESQGLWGVIVLFLMADLYVAPLFFYVRGQRTWPFVTGGLALLATLLSGFSIGMAYLPAAGALLVGLMFSVFSPAPNS